MMKKILVLMLVLGLASAASAFDDMRVTIDGLDYVEGTAVTIGTVVKVELIDNAANLAGAGGVTYVNVDYGNTPTETDTTPQFSMSNYSGWFWSINGGVGSSVVGSGLKFHVNKTGDTVTPYGTPGIGSSLGAALGMYVSTAEYTFVTTAEQTNLNLSGSWNGNDLTTSEVVGIPEPMTIALLGLGGLFLRRRK